MIAWLLGLALALGPDGTRTVPAGFAVETAADLRASLIALTFDPEGRALVSREDGGLVLLEDADGDGRFEVEHDFAPAITECQGLLYDGEVLWVTGVHGGVRGVHRVALEAGGRRAGAIAPLAEVVSAHGGPSPGEHGPHGLALGPDGRLYLTLGDHAQMARNAEPDSPVRSGYEGSTLPVIDDPLGHGNHVRWPAGHVVAIDRASGAHRLHSVGFRNAYDHAFSSDGELFTFDSDMEWAIGLPWYRAPRFVHAVPGADWGHRWGSSIWPDAWIDTLPPLAEVERGSPTGVCFYTARAFPERYRGALFAGDWSQGRILAVHLAPAGATFRGEVEVVVSTDEALPVTDLAVGPDGALYFTSGGRGAIGALERLVWTGARAERGADRAPEPRAGGLPDGDRPGRLAALVRGGLDRADPAELRRALEALFGAPPDDELVPWLYALLDHEDRFVRSAARFAILAWQRDVPAAVRTDVGWLERELVRWRLGAEVDVGGLLARVGRDDPEVVSGALRVLELALGSPGGASPEVVAALAAAFPHPDDGVSRQLAVLLVAHAPDIARPALVAALESASGPEQAIHYGYCLSAVRDGWQPKEARRFFRWLDRAERLEGGSSFAGYLAAMRARVTGCFDAAGRVALARETRLGARTVVDFMQGAEADVVEELVPPLQYAWGRLASIDDEKERRLERVHVLQELPSVPAPSLVAWLRRQVDAEGMPRNAALIALARIASPDDAPLFLEGLGRNVLDVPESSARALVAIDYVPSDARPVRRALEAARRLGAARGAEVLALLDRWLGRERAEAPEDWGAAIAGRELDAIQRWPSLAAEARTGDKRPAWGFDAVLAFLERSDGRPGSAARGARVYVEATCARCHLVEGSDAVGDRHFVGWGPELSTVSKRFDRRALLETIWYPSRVVSDQHATTIVTTTDDERYAGRLVRDDGDELELLETDGGRVIIARADVLDARSSELSAMPEGLLAARTLEEIKDLFAFLDAAGRTEPDAGPPFEPLFERERRAHWNADGGLWSIRGGLFVGSSGPDGVEASAYALSKTLHGDFELELDVRVEGRAANSGVLYRVDPDSSPLAPVGYQADVGQSHWGALFSTDGRGALATPDPALRRSAVDAEGWNHYFVRVRGDRHVIEVNGVTLVDVRDGARARGLLGFQLHAGPPMEVRVANARMRDLPGRGQ